MTVRITKTTDTDLVPDLRQLTDARTIPHPRCGDVIHFRVMGGIDAYTAPTLRRELNAQLDRSPPAIVIDLREVTFLGSAGLEILLDVRDRSLRTGTALRLLCSTRAVTRPLALFGTFSLDTETGVAV